MNFPRLAAYTILLCLIAAPASSRSTDPTPACPTDSRRVEYSDLVFCWSTGPEAPYFQTDSFVGFGVAQYWLGTMPVSKDEYEQSMDSKGDLPTDATFAIFRVFPRSQWGARGEERAFMGLDQITRAIRNLGEADSFSISIEFDKDIGHQELLFERASTDSFVARMNLPERIEVKQSLEYWVFLTSSGNLDYSLPCRITQFASSKEHRCNGLFFLGQNYAMALLQGGDSKTSRYIFERMRSQIRSYVLWPKLEQR